MKPALLLLSLVAASAFAQSPSSLADLEAKFKTLPEERGPGGLEARLKFNADVAKVLETGTITSGADFLKLRNMYSDFYLDYENTRVRHELGLAALALGEKEVEKSLPMAWDFFMVSLGRGQRFGSIKFGDTSDPFDRMYLRAAPASLAAVWKDPEAARKRAASAKDNPEAKQIVDADQAARKQDWMKLSSAEIEKISREDVLRAKRIREMVDKGDLVTGNDFYAASLVLQHGSVFESYSLAHELAVASMLLGNKNASWLAAATYDRMLGSIGHKQRYGTQYGSSGQRPIDGTAIGDSQRKAMGVRARAEGG